MSEQRREAAEKRAAAAAVSPDLVDALLRERNGYVVRGMADRVAAVDDYLRALGVEPPVDVKPEPKRSTRKS